MTAKYIIEKYGQDAALTDAAENKTIRFKAFVQALRYKNKLYLRGTYTELGRNQQDYYLYIGPGDVDISCVDAAARTLTVAGVSYVVDRTEKHYIGDTVIYHWAIIHPTVADNS
ncbi:MAG: hypothetical protein ACI4GA_07865 [Acutalibacteraceae bacterium]|nr:hypothetical protein [Oscillospiraceae bacterium]